MANMGILSDHGTAYAPLMNELRSVFASGRTLSYEFRLEQLKGLLRMLTERQDELMEALYKDMRKPKLEAFCFELIPIIIDINSAIKELKGWMKPEKKPINLIIAMDRGYLYKEPYGVVFVAGAFNYPYLLSIGAMWGAIAAGNCLVVKPSEYAPCSAAKLAELLPKYIDPKCYKVFLGGAQETADLLKHRFDYILSTSSAEVGKKIMTAAAKTLTPVTLELGGKCPLYIDDTVDMKVAASRIMWGKVLNSGQTCLSPDYILCSKKTEAYLLDCMREYMKRYGPDPKASPDMTRVINLTHFNRLKNLLDKTKGKFVIGGESDASELYISPTVLIDVQESDILMDDEIFGPITPIITCDSPEDAVKFINARPKPLALYVFTTDKKVIKLFSERTSSGSICFNDVVLQSGFEGLPFGGVQASGMGRYGSDMNGEKNRLKTLKHWPHKFGNIHKLAKSGLYFCGPRRDQLSCNFCDVQIADWVESDDPIVEHLRWSKHCPLLTRKSTDNRPISAAALDALLPPRPVYDVCGIQDVQHFGTPELDSCTDTE